MGLSMFEERQPISVSKNILGSTTPNAESTPYPPATGARYDNIFVTTNDTVPVTVAVTLTDSSSIEAWLGTVIVPAGAGTDGVTPAVELVGLLAAAQGGIVVGATCILTVRVMNAMTGGTNLYVSFLGGTL